MIVPLNNYPGILIVKEEKEMDIFEEITITKSDKTNLIEISDNKDHHFYLTLTTKDIATLFTTAVHLRKGETKKFAKE